MRTPVSTSLQSSWFTGDRSGGSCRCSEPGRHPDRAAGRFHGADGRAGAQHGRLNRTPAGAAVMGRPETGRGGDVHPPVQGVRESHRTRPPAPRPHWGQPPAEPARPSRSDPRRWCAPWPGTTGPHTEPDPPPSRPGMTRTSRPPAGTNETRPSPPAPPWWPSEPWWQGGTTTGIVVGSPALEGARRRLRRGRRAGPGRVVGVETLGPGETTPIRVEPPPDQLTTARATAAAAAAATIATRPARRRRRKRNRGRVAGLRPAVRTGGDGRRLTVERATQPVDELVVVHSSMLLRSRRARWVADFTVPTRQPSRAATSASGRSR